jgi:hypothetical protein
LGRTGCQDLIEPAAEVGASLIAALQAIAKIVTRLALAASAAGILSWLVRVDGRVARVPGRLTRIASRFVGVPGRRIGIPSGLLSPRRIGTRLRGAVTI